MVMPASSRAVLPAPSQPSTTGPVNARRSPAMRACTQTGGPASGPRAPSSRNTSVGEEQGRGAADRPGADDDDRLRGTRVLVVPAPEAARITALDLPENRHLVAAPQGCAPPLAGRPGHEKEKEENTER